MEKRYLHPILPKLGNTKRGDPQLKIPFDTKPSFFNHPIIFLAQKKIQLSKFRQRWLYVGRLIVN